MILKNLVLQALGTIRFRFLQKKSKQKIHACVPLGMTKDENELVPFEGLLLINLESMKKSEKCIFLPWYVLI